MRLLFLMSVSTCFYYVLNSQTNHLHVEGHAKIRGDLDIANMEDTTSIYIGKSAGELSELASALSNTFLGVNAGKMNISGSRNSFFRTRCWNG